MTPAAEGHSVLVTVDVVVGLGAALQGGENAKDYIDGYSCHRVFTPGHTNGIYTRTIDPMSNNATSAGSPNFAGILGLGGAGNGYSQNALPHVENNSFYAVMVPTGSAPSMIEHGESTFAAEIGANVLQPTRMEGVLYLGAAVDWIAARILSSGFGVAGSRSGRIKDPNIHPTYATQVASAAAWSLLEAKAGQLAGQMHPAPPEHQDPVEEPGGSTTWHCYHRSLSWPLPAAARGSCELAAYIESGAVKLIAPADVQARNQAALTAMQTAEAEKLAQLRDSTLTGVLPGATAFAVFPAAVEDPAVDAATRAKITATKSSLMSAYTAAQSKMGSQARKDALWARYQKLHPESTLSRADFELNPSAYLTAAELSDGVAGEKSWWESTLGVLGWIGSTAVDTLKSVDGSTLATLFAAGAVSGLFGDNLQTYAILGIGAWLLLRGRSSNTTVVVRDEPKAKQ